jgi:hypothetical protein
MPMSYRGQSGTLGARATGGGVLAVVLLGVLARVWLLGDAVPALFWDSQSYIDYAADTVARRTLPPIGIRAPGYPLFLLASGGAPPDLHRVIRIQQTLGVVTCVLVFLCLKVLGRATLTAMIGCLLLTSLVDLLFMEVTIYSETLATFLATASLFGCVVGMKHPGGSTPRGVALLLAGLLAGMASFVRPSLVVLVGAVPLGMLVAVAACRNTAVAARDVAAWLLLSVLLLGGWAAWNQAHGYGFRLALGRGFSLLNYTGRPEIYSRLPEHMQDVTALYRELAAEHRTENVGWGLALGPALALMTAKGEDTSDWDRAAHAFAMRAIIEQPAGYLRVWWRVLAEYLTDYFVWFGLLQNERVVQEGPASQVGETQYRVVRGAERAWKFGFFFLTLATLGLPLWLARRSRDGTAAVLLVLWTVFVSYSIATTLAEPSRGQHRYRMPLEPTMIVVAVTGLASLRAPRRSLWARGSDANREPGGAPLALHSRAGRSSDCGFVSPETRRPRSACFATPRSGLVTSPWRTRGGPSADRARDSRSASSTTSGSIPRRSTGRTAWRWSSTCRCSRGGTCWRRC